MAVDLTALATEINTDPASLGLVALKNAGSDQAIADALNLVRAGAGFVVNRTDISARELMGAVVNTEYLALDTGHQNLWQTLLITAPVDASNTQTRTTVAAIFSSGTTTRANLVALSTRQGSRAEVLWGAGTVVRAIDVSRALARPGVQ